MSSDGWYDETAYSTPEDALKKMTYPSSKLHKKELYQEEQEILKHICGWSHVMNKEFNKSIEPGRPFYLFDEAISYDIYGFTPRGAFKQHFDETFHYFSNSRFEMKDLEVFATSKDTGYATMMQRLVGGTSDDGAKFEMTYRLTYIVNKIDGAWKYVHEHVSFPVDMSTMKADPTCTIDPLKAFRGIAN